ncbi:MAG: class I SAM-dependent methyltransferase [Solirubrobacterales bacterium]|nr:class I SAM-dependent methyltransferase [Solirubrobacterales bacterium]
MTAAHGAPDTLPEPQVRAMFDRIARVYDLMNSVMTAGLHHQWRRRAADLAAIGPGDRVLDVATGTGDLAIELASRVGPSGEVVGGEFDAATVGFGARNFSDLGKGLSEMARVVRPGGRVVVLEITTPTRPPLSTFYSAWFDRVVPAIGKLTGEDVAYDYLPKSVKRFPGPEGLAATMDAAGLTNLRWILTAGGIIALHVGEKPAA